MKNTSNHKFFIISISVIVMIILWVLLITKGEYGTTLFFSIPATIGFLIGYSQKYNSKNDEKLKKGIKAFAVTLFIILGLSALLIVIGIEGAICIVMAFPFLIIPIFIAYLIGNYIGGKDRNIKTNSMVFIILLLLNPTSYIYDSYITPINDEVTSELVINKPKNIIWSKLTSEITFKNIDGVIFKKGVSYPKKIMFNNSPKPNYVCHTNNDTINLDISHLKIKEEVTFKLRQQTVPMKEISVHETVNAEHLHNYFNVNYGIIKLDSIAPNKTKVIAKTSYNYKIAPKWYWKLWTNYLINEMHLHVLKSL